MVLVANIYNRTKVISPQPFQVANFIGYNLILGYPWLVKVDFKIRFKIGAFKQWNDKELEGCILLISLKYILEDIALGEIVYALYLKEYQISPLFYSKISIKPSIGNNSSIIDTLQGTARQVIETLQRGGDLKDLIGYSTAIGYSGLSNTQKVYYNTLNAMLKSSLPSTGYYIKLFNVQWQLYTNSYYSARCCPRAF